MYYPSALASVWAPNGEKTYQYYNIAPYSNERGDANGDGEVNARDAAAILRSIVRLERLSSRGIQNASLTGGDMPSAADAARILRYIVKLETDL